MIQLLKEAGPFAFLSVAAGGLGVALAGVTLVLTATKSKAASVTGILCLLLAAAILCLGVIGHAVGLVGTNASIGNVPDDMKDLLLRKGTEESRSNLVIALACAALPFLAGAVAVAVRRLAAGIALAVAVAAFCAALLVAFTRPLPPAGPRVAMVSGLELPPSSSWRPLGTWALIAVSTEGLWVDGAKVPTLPHALSHPQVAERNAWRLPLLVDRRVQFGQLADVLQVASSVGRHEVELVVRSPDGAERVIPVRDTPKKNVDKPLLLTVAISDSAVKIGAVGGSLDPLPRDWRALNDKLTEIKTAFPDERTLRVTATPDTSVGDLIAALDAARERDGRPLFDEVVVGRLSLPEPVAAPVEAKPTDAVRGRAADVAPEIPAGGIERGALERYVKARKPAIVACYEMELRRDASLKGKVVVQFSISPNGRATGVEIAESSLGNDAVGSCIQKLIRTWVFPFRPEEEVAVAFPFVFSPVQ